MTQRLNLVSGGERVDPDRGAAVTSVDDLHVVGAFPDCASVRYALTPEAHRRRDAAHMRSFIAPGDRLLEEGEEAAATAEVAT